MEFENVGPGNREFWNTGRQIFLTETRLIAEEELPNSINDYALKFEIYVKEPWNYGSLVINPRSAWSNLLYYNPWKVGEDATKPFSTEGWATVTIPLKSFNASSLSALLGDTGMGAFQFMFWNDTSGTVEKFAAAIDNIRIVKVK
jgi:hypothetical protein